ncbi:TrkH family potassium uptake protein [Pseudogemmobacter sp. W21_MBD1_M6]|uniref:TrkH family potassium uptake protein n=1 Tax=Pseudogemmobacter sp. W21_MBD1_M6 TaxID=3240271 RepID=UPI003F953F6C
MIARILALPFIVILMGIGAAAMIVPALQAAAVQDFYVARVFLYGAVLFLMLTSLIGIATANYAPKNLARSHLLALVAAFAALPLMLAVPFHEAVRNTSFLNSYFEMVSSMTTTGATLFDDPTRLPGAVHLWRALVGWMGGFLVWVTAVAVLAPMNLGGFEVTSPTALGRSTERFSQISQVAATPERLTRYAAQLFPIYSALTLILWVLLLLAGDVPLVAVCHAMATLSTSGISPVGGLSGAKSGPLGELAVFAFLFFAISRRTFTKDFQSEAEHGLLSDREFRMGLICVIVVPLFLFLRHWVGAVEVDRIQDFGAALRALWGGVFTVLSFLTTTGFASVDWTEARSWSGLQTPGLLLMGLALTGGGVATTAGGVKLLRVYALYMHGSREIERLVHPHSVGGSGAYARRIRREGAYIAWIFFMLFALSITVVMLALSLTGENLETAMVLSVASLSTTGPVAAVATSTPISYAALSEAAKLILAAAMVLGRLETLAIIALLNPDFWRA